jgi:hypothetical protein
VKRKDGIAALHQRKRMLLAAQTALQHFHRELEAQKIILDEKLFSKEDLVFVAQDIEFTYFVRMFANFEEILRDYWKNGCGRTTHPDMKPLMNSIAAHRRIPFDIVQGAHDARETRNALMHPDRELKNFMSFNEAESWLSQYLRRLPLDWS